MIVATLPNALCMVYTYKNLVIPYIAIEILAVYSEFSNKNIEMFHSLSDWVMVFATYRVLLLCFWATGGPAPDAKEKHIHLVTNDRRRIRRRRR